jgi:drug/metabolite transporter (DMT)-like permease
MDKGIKLALVTAVVSGVAIFINKLAVGMMRPPLVFTAVKNTGVAVLIFGWLVVSGKWWKVGSLRRGEMGKLLLVGIVGGAVPFYLFFTGLAQIPAVNAALIHKTLVLWVAILAVPLLKERLSLLQMGALLMLFYANLAVGGFRGFEYSTGELMVLGATILWAVENVVAKIVLKTVDPDLVVGARMGLGAMVLLGAAIVQGQPIGYQILGLSWGEVGLLVATAGTLLVYVTSWYRALKRAPVTTVATVLTGSVLVTNFLSAVLITRVWGMEMVWQAGLILLGVGLFVWELRRMGRVGGEEAGELLEQAVS